MRLFVDEILRADAKKLAAAIAHQEFVAGDDLQNTVLSAKQYEHLINQLKEEISQKERNTDDNSRADSDNILTVYRAYEPLSDDLGREEIIYQVGTFKISDTENLSEFVSEYDDGDISSFWEKPRSFELYATTFMPTEDMLRCYVLMDLGDDYIDKYDTLAALVRELTFMGWNLAENDARKTELSEEISSALEKADEENTYYSSENVFEELRRKYGLHVPTDEERKLIREAYERTMRMNAIEYMRHCKRLLKVLST